MLKVEKVVVESLRSYKYYVGPLFVIKSVLIVTAIMLDFLELRGKVDSSRAVDSINTKTIV